MKVLASVFALALLCLDASVLHAQSPFTYDVTVRNYRGRPQSDIRVWWKEKNTGQIIDRRTNTEGKILFEIPPGEWSISLAGMPDYREIRIREGSTGGGSMSISYDLAIIKREDALRKAREKAIFETTDQTGKFYRQPTRGTAVVNVQVRNKEKRPLAGVEVDLLGPKGGKQFSSRTSRSGTASFLVPVGETYIVDLAGIKNHGFTPNIKQESVHTLKYTYVPTNIQEWDRNDTITQKLKLNEAPTTARVKFQLNVSGGNHPEPIYLNQISGKKVFYGETDRDGKVTFLLPKGEKYMLHFQFAKDVDVINLSKVQGIGHKSMSIGYVADPQLQYPERYLPDPDNLFLQEFESFITQNLPAPNNGKKLGLFLRWGNGAVISNSREAVLQIGVSGSNEKQSRSKEVDLAFVIDKSGSMEGYDRLEAVKETMIELVDDLMPGDRVGLYAFNSHSSTLLPVTRLGTGSTLKARIEELEAGGGTNIYSGLQSGFEGLNEKSSPNRPRQVLLLTDGYGSTRPKKVVELADGYRTQGIDLSAIGVGQGYNYALLSLLTQNQGGLLSQANEAADIKRCFRDQLNGLIAPVAEKATLSIQFHDKIRFQELFGADVKETGTDRVSIDLGTIYRGYQKTALAQFDLKKPDQSIENEPVLIRLDYFDPATGKKEKVVEKAYLKWEPATGRMQVILDREMKKLYAIAIMNQSMKVLVDAVANGDYSKARSAVDDCLAQVKELFPEADDKDVKNLVDQMTGYALAIERVAQKKGNQVVKSN